MKEKELKALAKKRLDDAGYTHWWPPRVGWYQQSDVKDLFGVFDCVAARNGKIKFIQITTSPNLSARRKKIQAWMITAGNVPRCWVWAWHKKREAWVMELIAPLPITIDNADTS
jgi:hypothetical protein